MKSFAVATFRYTLIVWLVVFFGGPTVSRAQEALKPAEEAGLYAQREAAAPEQIRQELQQLRTVIAEKNLHFQVGYTKAMDIPLDQLAGTRFPPPDQLKPLAERVNARAVQLLKFDSSARAKFLSVNPQAEIEKQIPPNCESLPEFDWRKQGKVTPIRDQRACGSCWDFSAMAAFESSELIRNNLSTDTSEQQVLDCSGGGSCAGGWYMPVFDWTIKHGVGKEADDPYTATSGACKTGMNSPFQAVAWGFVQADGGIPTVPALKQAICKYGANSVAVEATAAFQAYVGGVFDEHDTSHGINHAVALVGWDDSKKAWLMKNSWGTDWGETGGYGSERGYMWIAYDSNNIGYHAAWVLAKSSSYVLPHLFELEVEKIRPIPLPEVIQQHESH
jgi:cathepsin L